MSVEQYSLVANDWLNLEFIINDLSQRVIGQEIYPTSNPTFAGLTLTSLTASRLISSDANKALSSVSDLTSWIAGTTNQITVTDDSDGTVTLSTPQDIHTAATPTFAGLVFTNGAFSLTPSTTDTDIVVTFTGTTNSGVLSWMEDEDYFKFSDDIFVGSEEILGDKFKITTIGGYAVKLTNQTGANTIAGQLVKADTASDDAVILTAAGDNECFGVFLDSGIADGSEAWVVISGIADVAMEDNTAATHGNWVQTSDAEVGYANATSATPAAAPAHFEEIGHCIESVAAGGGGTHILARCIVHFN